jgi:hypothetical protein
MAWKKNNAVKGTRPIHNINTITAFYIIMPKIVTKYSEKATLYITSF